MNPEFLKMQLLTAVIPATICGVIVLLLSRPWNKDLRATSETPNLYGHNALGLACGFMFAFWAIMGQVPSFPAGEAYHNLFYVSVGIALVAFVNSFSSNWVLRVAFVISLAAIASYFVTPRYIFEDEDGHLMNSIWLWRAGYVGIATILFLSAEKIDEKIYSSLHAFTWFIIATACSLLMIMAASAKLAQICGAISAMSMAITVVCLLFSYIPLTRSATYFTAIFLTGVVFNGYWLGNGKIPLAVFLLILSSPIFSWLGQLKFVKEKPAIWSIATTIVATLIPVSISLLIAYQYYSME